MEDKGGFFGTQHRGCVSRKPNNIAWKRMMMEEADGGIKGPSPVTIGAFSQHSADRGQRNRLTQNATINPVSAINTFVMNNQLWSIRGDFITR